MALLVAGVVLHVFGWAQMSGVRTFPMKTCNISVPHNTITFTLALNYSSMCFYDQQELQFLTITRECKLCNFALSVYLKWSFKGQYKAPRVRSS